ncbi:MAG: hypothetical protein E7597_08275, partial [Ruminococcaceae bacterium]|nr:hypothetical protein [Oscillospiraceae bacterium]
MHKFISVLMACLMLFTVITVSAEDTVYIDSAEDLRAFSARVAAGDRMTGVSVVLRADIALEGDFTPIGTDTSTPFSGSFDGGGHTVSGLTVQGEAYLGLFGCITDGSVKNLNIENATVIGGDYCGLLVGRLYAYKGDGAVENCQVSGSVTGGSYVGGLAGMVCAAAYDYSADAWVKESGAQATVNGDLYVGGIAGCAEARGNSKTATVLIKDCVSKGFVQAKGNFGTMAGGICGALSAKDNGGNAVAELDSCISYAMAVAEKLAAGGICGTAGAVGEYSIAAAANSVSYGYVSGGAKVGGFCGKAETSGGTVGFENCVSAGCVAGTDIHAVGFGAEGCNRV